MDMIKKYFPLAFTAKADITALVISILIQCVIGFVAGFVIGIGGMLPFVGVVFNLIGWLVELYVGVSLILTLLDYFKVLK